MVVIIRPVLPLLKFLIAVEVCASDPGEFSCNAWANNGLWVCLIEVVVAFVEHKINASFAVLDLIETRFRHSKGGARGDIKKQATLKLPAYSVNFTWHHFLVYF